MNMDLDGFLKPCFLFASLPYCVTIELEIIYWTTFGLSICSMLFQQLQLAKIRIKVGK